MTWVNDKAGLFFGRGEAPIIGLPTKLAEDESLFIVTGSMPNTKSTPLVDEWFCLRFKDGIFQGVMTMNEMVQRTGLRGGSIPNTNAVTEEVIQLSEVLLDEVVDRAKDYLHSKFLAYQERMNPLLDEEVDKLIELQNKHHQYYQMTLFEQERKLEEKERSVDELFESFITWVTDTLTIQNNPYIRIAAVLTGVAQ